MSTCPFCARDPFHYVDIGVGYAPAAVDCCGLGDLYFRGARPAPETAEISWDEFCEIGSTISSLRHEVGKLNALLIDRCVCKFDADGNAYDECIEHLQLRTERDAARQEVETLREALEGLLNETEHLPARSTSPGLDVACLKGRGLLLKANTRALLPKDKP